MRGAQAAWRRFPGALTDWILFFHRECAVASAMSAAAPGGLLLACSLAFTALLTGERKGWGPTLACIASVSRIPACLPALLQSPPLGGGERTKRSVWKCDSWALAGSV